MDCNEMSDFVCAATIRAMCSEGKRMDICDLQGKHSQGDVCIQLGPTGNTKYMTSRLKHCEEQWLGILLMAVVSFLRIRASKQEYKIVP